MTTTTPNLESRLVYWCKHCCHHVSISYGRECPSVDCVREDGWQTRMRKRRMWVCPECECAYFKKPEEHTCHDCY